jgi:hypothetical protein
MCEPTTIALIATAAGTAISAKASYDQGQVTKQVGQNNATMAEYAAQDAARRGEEDAQAVQRRGAALKSAQRVSLAAKGLDLGYGTAADLQDQTDFFTQSDVATTRSNAAREVWSLRTRGENARREGQLAAREGTMRAAGTLLAGGGQVADKWYQFNPTTVPTMPRPTSPARKPGY